MDNKRYCNKYNSNSKVLAALFGNHYSLILGRGIVSNVVAVSGSDLERYIRYFEPMLKRCRKRPTFTIVENDQTRYKELRKKLRHLQKTPSPYQETANHTIIGLGSIFAYEHIIVNNKPKKLLPCRVEDMGTGQKITKLIRCAIPRLDTQAHSPQANFQNRYKVQILDGARKFASDEKVVKLLRDYLALTDTDLISINGKKIDETGSFFGDRGVKVFSCYDAVRMGHIVNVYRHCIKLKSSRKYLDFKLYTYINGGMMLNTLLVYK